MIENDSTLFKVNIDNYNGPLDVLLDLEIGRAHVRTPVTA